MKFLGQFPPFVYNLPSCFFSHWSIMLPPNAYMQKNNGTKYRRMGELTQQLQWLQLLTLFLFNKNNLVKIAKCWSKNTSKNRSSQRRNRPTCMMQEKFLAHFCQVLCTQIFLNRFGGKRVTETVGLIVPPSLSVINSFFFSRN